tara:strand:+ start:2014 stop:2175 length:162 start_codon:yes stop_codon:yes gene_type:complete
LIALIFAGRSCKGVSGASLDFRLEVGSSSAIFTDLDGGKTRDVEFVDTVEIVS